jgi:hypothetical protein
MREQCFDPHPRVQLDLKCKARGVRIERRVYSTVDYSCISFLLCLIAIYIYVCTLIGNVLKKQ